MFSHYTIPLNATVQIVADEPFTVEGFIGPIDHNKELFYAEEKTFHPGQLLKVFVDEVDEDFVDITIPRESSHMTNLVTKLVRCPRDVFRVTMKAV
jgi:hypothetical protein